MGDKIKKLLKVKLWLAVIGLALFGFTLIFNNAPEAHSQYDGYICQVFPELMGASASLSVKNQRTGETVTINSYSDAAASPGTLNIYSGDSLSISFSGGVSPSDGYTIYSGAISLNNAYSYFWNNTAQPISYGPVTAGGYIEYYVSECNVSASAAVNINIVTPPPTLTFWASSTTVYTDQTPTLYWKSTGAYGGSMCSAGIGWGGTKGSDSGVTYSQQVGPYGWAGTASYALQCLGPGGWSDTKTVSINVINRPAPTASIGATSTSIPYNTGTTINWSSTNTTRCEVKKDGVIISGWTATMDSKPTGNLTTTATYSVTCYNEIGTASSSPSVTINVASSPDVSVSCTPNLVIVNQNSSGSFSLTTTSLNGFTGPVTWSTTSAIPAGTTLSYSNNGASLTSGGSATVIATLTTTYSTPAATSDFIFTASSSAGTKTCGNVQLQVRPRPTATITAATTSLPYGGSTTINWSSNYATSCAVSKDNVAVTGWTSVSATNQPTPVLYATTTYSITCSGDGGTSAPASVTITVASVPTATISAASTSIEYSAFTNITWGSTNSSSCVLKKDGVTIATWTGTSGTQATGPLYATATYSAICYNSVNYASNTATVTITVASAPTATINAASTNIAYNGSTTITWGSSNATAGCVLKKDGVTIAGWTGISGTQPTGALTANATYIATCSNNAGASASANVTVSVAGGPTATISAAATSLPYNGSTTISWNSTNTTGCTVTKDGVAVAGWTAVSATNQSTPNLTATTTYTATCSNSAGASASAYVTITVDGAPTATISATSTSLAYSGSTTITWGSTNSSSCVLKKDGVTLTSWTGTSGSQPTGNLYASTTYSVTCYNSISYASNTPTVTITVASVPTAAISAGSINIAYGGSTTITWGSTNASSCVLQKDGVTLTSWTGTSGSQPTGALYASTTYSATCYNSANYPSSTVTVKVNPPNPSISVSCTPATYTVTQGSTASFALQFTSQNGFSGPVTWSLAGSAPTNSTLTYNNNGASLTVGGSATTTAIFQTQYTTPTGTYNFTFNTSSTAATQSCGVQLIVSGAAPLITLTANLSANNLTVNYYDYVTIAWSSTNATSCTISPTGWTGTSGSQTVGPVTGNLSYSATCTSAAGLNAYASVFITVNDPNISNATVDAIGYTLSTDQNTLTTTASGKRPCYSPCTRDSYFDVTINGEVQKVTDAGTTITQWSGNIYYPQITSLSTWSWPARAQDTGTVSTPNPVTPLNISSWPNGNYRFCATVSGSTTAVYPDVSTTYSKCTSVFTVNNRDFTLTCSITALSLNTITTQGSVSLTTAANTGFSSPVVFSNSISPSTGTLPSISYTNNGQVPNATTTALIAVTAATTPATYIITFTGTGGGVSKSCNVQLNLTPSAAISASPTAVASGGSSNITWTSTFANSCSVTSIPTGFNWTGVAGTQTATNLTNDTTFNLSCSGPGGSATASVTVRVGPSGYIKCNSTSDGPCEVPYETSSILKWSSQNATSCKVTKTVGGVTTDFATTLNSDTNGNPSGGIIATNVFTLICSNAVLSNVTIGSVQVKPPSPSLSLSCGTVTQTTNQNSSASFVFTIASQNGFSGAVTLSTTGLPTVSSVSYFENNTSLSNPFTLANKASKVVSMLITTQYTTVPQTYGFTLTPTAASPVTPTTCDFQLIVTAVPPSTSALTVDNSTCQELNFSWKAPTNNPQPTNYSLYQSGSIQPIYSTNASANSSYQYSYKYSVQNLTADQLMYFVLVSYNNTVSSGNEGIYQASTLKKCVPNMDISQKEIISAIRSNTTKVIPNASLNEGDGISNAFVFPDGGRFRVGDTVNFKIIVQNNGNVTLTDLTVQDTPYNVNLVNSFTASSFIPAACATYDATTNQFNITQLIPNQVCSILISGTVNDPTKSGGQRPYYFQNKARITGKSARDGTTKTVDIMTPAYSIDVDIGVPTRTETAP